MAQSRRRQDVLIALLAVVAVGASAFAVWSVNRPYQPADGESTAGAPVTADEPAYRASPTTEQITTPGQVGDTASDPEEDEGDSTPDEVATADPERGDTDVSAWVDAWSDDDAHLLVVGDGFSNLPTQWVQLWATIVGQGRPVTIHHWGEAEDVSFNDPIVLSEGAGPALTVWSASRDGTTIQGAAERFAGFVDASTDPDAVLVSLGLHSDDEDIAEGLDQLVDEIDEDLPVLIGIGPDGLYDEGVGDALLEWSRDNDDRVAVVDLRGVAPDEATAEEWAVAFAEALDQT